MKFALTLIPIVAALGFVAAGPVANGLTQLAPAPVTKLVCDGDSYKCTASLDFGDGRWVAQWSTAVFHQGLFGLTEERMTSMAPVPVTQLECDGDSYKCTANLEFGDGRWVAQWSTSVFHQALFNHEVVAMAPVPVTKLTCDGNTYQCTGNLKFGDGRWVAQWGTAVFHTGF